MTDPTDSYSENDTNDPFAQTENPNVWEPDEVTDPFDYGIQIPWDGVPAYIRGPQSIILENNPFIGDNSTKIVLIGVDNSWWDLAGAYAGRQGLSLSNHLLGLMYPPFKSLFTEGPYQIGAYYERTDYPQRKMNIGIDVGVDIAGSPSSIKYRMLEQRWWRAWAVDTDGYLMVYTKTHGWRILKVRLSEGPNTPMELDPVAFENNFMHWDMVITAINPYYGKKTVTDSWSNTSATATPVETILDMLENTINQFLGQVLLGAGGTLVPGVNVGSGHLNVWNNSDITQWPKFLVSSPGQAWIEDGPGTGNMIALPATQTDIGTFMVDTDPQAQTISAENDPVQPLFYQIASNSGLLDLVLGNLTAQDTPLWQQFTGRFQVPAPARTLCSYKVYHSDASGVIQIMMPQQFNMAYG